MHSPNPEIPPITPPVVPSGAGSSQRPTETYVSRGPDAVPAGGTVGKFRVVKVLGEGGQAVTYLALDPDTRRHVVLKWFRDVRSPENVEIIFSEARALARVESLHVPRCLAVERHEGAPYLVIEYVGGETLAAWMRGRGAAPVPPAEAMELTRQVVQGLEAVHAAGVTHRDLKPANVIRGTDGRLRLVDFGLTRPLGEAGSEGASGTPLYMAPEQAIAPQDRADVRTDVFGAGAVLYELLTGVPPRHGAHGAELWEQVRTGDILSARERNPKIPGSAERLCMRCLARNPADRFPSAAALHRAIRGWQLRRRLGPYLLAGIVAVALLAGFLIWQATRDPKPTDPPPAKDPLANRTLRHEFPLAVELVGGRLAPDGNGHVLTEGERFTLRVRSEIDCHVEVWFLDEHGNFTRLFPNRHQLDGRLSRGQAHLIPAVGAAYAFQATASDVPEQLLVIASTMPLPSLQGEVRGSFEEFATPERRADWSLKRGVDVVSTESALKVAEQVIRIARVERR